MRPPHVVERLKHHALAVLFVLLAFGLTLALQAVTSRAYYILFVPAVMFAAWYGGLARPRGQQRWTVGRAAFGSGSDSTE